MSAALTTRGARNLRPAAVFAAVLMAAAVLVGLVVLAGSLTAINRPAAPHADNPLAVPATTDQTGIPYQGTGPAADIIRGANGPATGAATGGTSAPVAPATVDQTRIPYQGTGPAADIIRAGSGAATNQTGIPYQGTGPAAEIIRGSYSATDSSQALAVPATTDSTGIPYQGTGPAADLIRAGSGLPIVYPGNHPWRPGK